LGDLEIGNQYYFSPTQSVRARKSKHRNGLSDRSGRAGNHLTFRPPRDFRTSVLEQPHSEYFRANLTSPEAANNRCRHVPFMLALRKSSVIGAINFFRKRFLAGRVPGY
jgi:hypothetical protein